LRSYELRNGCNVCRAIETAVDVKLSNNPTFLIQQRQEQEAIIEWACTKKYSSEVCAAICGELRETYLLTLVIILGSLSDVICVVPDTTSMTRVFNILKFFQVPKRQLSGFALKRHSGTNYNDAYVMNGSSIKPSVFMCVCSLVSRGYI
jgi:hypothetical protein